MQASLSNFSVPTADGGAGNTALLMPKLKYRFRVTFLNFGNTATDTTNMLELTRQVAEASRPTVTFEDKTIDVYNSIIHYAGKPKWGPISVKIRDDSSNLVNSVVGQQNQKQFDFFEQSSAAAAGEYKFQMTIEILDGGNSANFAEATNVLEKWECYGCYLVSSTYGSLAYNTADPMLIELSIQPDNCVQFTTLGGIGAQDTQRTFNSTTVVG